MFSETSFVSKQPKLEPKPVCFGCFALISKQGALVFRNNRNKQKTNQNSSKFVKIWTFLIPHTTSSVCFSGFDNGPKHRNKPKQTETNRKKCFLVSRNKPKNNRNRLSFGLFRFEPKKIRLFQGHRKFCPSPTCCWSASIFADPEPCSTWAAVIKVEENN